MSLLGNILGGGIGLLGGAAHGRQQRKNIQAQLNADRQLAQYAYNQDLDMWRRQNEYNAPTQQMARLREAGLNPHLVYGSGQVAGNTSGQMPKYQQVRSDYSSRQPLFNPMQILDAYQNTRMKSAEIDLVEQRARREGAEADFADSNAFLKNLMNTNKADLINLKRALEFGGFGSIYDTAGKKFDVSKTFMKQRMDAELGKTQAQTKGYIVGEQLKQIEREFAENMKKMGLSKGYGGLLMQLFRISTGR